MRKLKFHSQSKNCAFSRYLAQRLYEGRLVRELIIRELNKNNSKNYCFLSAPRSRGVSGAKKAIWVINEKHLAEHNPF